MDVALPHDFTPRPYQRRVWRYFEGGGKRAYCVWHRRSGKDFNAAHLTCTAAHEKVGVYWHVFPSFEQARRSIWEGYTRDGKRLLENVFPGFTDPKSAGSIVKRKNEQQLFLELKAGSVWRLMGSDRSEFVGAGPQGVVFSEFALCRPSTWDLVRPMLRESGGWAHFITTPRGHNHAKRLWDDATVEAGWFRNRQTVEDTEGQIAWASNRGGHAISAAQMLEEERAEGMEEALIRQEYLCDWSAANVGSVYGDLMEQLEARGGLADFEADTDDIFTSWDLGYSDSTAVWFWRLRGTEVEVVDFMEGSGKPLSHYLDEVEKRGSIYGYRGHWLPHDARAKTLVTGASVMEAVAARLGGERVRITPMLSLADGIQAARWLLQQGTRIHPRCGEGIEALRQYHYAYDEDTKTYSRKPQHDWSSHAADAFRYLAVARRMADGMVPKTLTVPRLVVTPAAPTLGNPWERDVRRGKRERV